MFVTPEILAITTPPFGETLRDVRLAEFGNWLDAFSEHGRISVAENPRRKPAETMLARVDPVDADFWSIRVTDPQETEGIRSIGAFVEKNEFVALTWDCRENIGSEFHLEVAEARERWTDFFGEATPHGGPTLDAYLTNYWRV